MLHNAPSTSSDLQHDNGAFATAKKKRRPAGTPDPEAEVVSLSPKTLLESDRYVCEICNQGFQRDQNLQMHRRRHKVPWQLLKRSSTADDEQGGSKAAVKKVYVCPEPSCLHHDPRHALGDLVGIKKHFRRKHSTHKQWVCDKCSKAYAVQSDYKAHLKTCGTRGHSCDCGRVFSRVESFIEHQDVCTIRHLNPEDEHHHHHQVVKMSGNKTHKNNNSSRTEESSSSAASTELPYFTNHHHHHVMNKLRPPPPPPPDETLNFAMNLDAASSDHQNQLLDLSIGLGLGGGEMMGINNNNDKSTSSSAKMLREYANEQLRVAAAEKAYAEEARQQARRQVEIAELEFANAQRMRLQAQAELERAHQLLNQQAASTLMTQITCPACNRTTSYPTPPSSLATLHHDDSSSLAISYMSSPTTDAD